MSTPAQRLARAIDECADHLGKEPQEISWAEVNKYTGYSASSGGSKCKILMIGDVAKAGGFSAVKDAYFAPKSNADKKSIKDAASLNRKVALEGSKQDIFIEEFKVVCDGLFKNVVTPKWKPPVSKKKTKRIINAVLSDTHFGSDLSSEETGGSLSFGRIEEARRLAAFVKEIANYKSQYRDETELELLVLGDIINGHLHDPRQGAPHAEQHARGIHLLEKAITYLSGAFKKVNVRFATGNHGRNTARHKQRATFEKWDSIETTVYYPVAKLVERLGNVKCFLPKTPFVTYENFGNKIWASHGDTVLNAGNPSKTISISSIEKQTYQINNGLKALSMQNKQNYDDFKLFVLGHTHTGHQSFLPNGAVLLINGALTPADSYAQSLGILDSQAGQWIFESTPEYVFGDSRFVRFHNGHDRDKSLDKIIPPWKDFDSR